MTPFFLPAETLNNIRKSGLSGQVSLKLANKLGMVYVELRDQTRSVLDGGNPLGKETSATVKKVFKTTIPSSVAKVMSVKPQELKKSKEYTIKDLEELFDVYYKLLQEVLPNFAGTIFTNLSDRITIRKIAGM